MDKTTNEIMVPKLKEYVSTSETVSLKGMKDYLNSRGIFATFDKIIIILKDNHELREMISQKIN
jgi:hypothetical protein